MIKSHSSSFLQSLTTFLLILGSSSAIGKAVAVPPSKTFSYDLDALSFSRGYDRTEYDVKYHDLPIQNDPFLCFYEANPESTGINKPVRNSYILAIGMGRRFGNADGITRWQTKTSNKGVVDIKLLPNGNLVLVDRNGGFVWQSFYYPTNTLLVGQGLGPGSSTTNKIVNGDYSMVLLDTTLSLFFNPNPKLASASSKPFSYYNLTQMAAVWINITFDSSKYFYEAGSYYEVLSIAINTDSSFELAHPKYNSSLSMLRLGSNGNLYIYTCNYVPATGVNVWEETYATFSRQGRTSECYLPSKCGSFGLCEDDQCKCKLPKIPSCNTSAAANVGYYRVKDVKDYRLDYYVGEGPMTINECMKKCSDDCKCVGFFYINDGSKCSLAAEFNTLAKIDANFERLIDAYIKYAK
ncbi:hypothetical protein MKX01_012873 [Papaver californicum]|nr:hypothetical protein MKX01_012873 [Papaver californicum]